MEKVLFPQEDLKADGHSEWIWMEEFFLEGSSLLWQKAQYLKKIKLILCPEMSDWTFFLTDNTKKCSLSA